MDIQNWMINGTFAGQIAQKLDESDGKKDGSIDASIWNKFVEDKGGKTINNQISLVSAIKSITTYAVRMAGVLGTTADELAKTWLNGSAGSLPVKDENPPQTDPNPPIKDDNPPIKDDNPLVDGEDLNSNTKYTTKHPELAGQKVQNDDGTWTEYDKNGYVEREYDADGNMTRDVLRNPDGSVCYYEDYEYDADGNKTREVWRNPDGSERFSF